MVVFCELLSCLCGKVVCIDMHKLFPNNNSEFNKKCANTYRGLLTAYLAFNEGVKIWVSCKNLFICMTSQVLHHYSC